MLVDITNSQGSAITTGVSATTLAAAAGKLSSAIDNTEKSCKTVNLELVFTVAGTAIADETVDVYVLPSLDGTNYEDGGAAVEPGKTAAGSFVARAVSTPQRCCLTGITVPPTNYKLLLWNQMTVGKDITAMTLSAYPEYEKQLIR
jgi:hypothetical protein